VTRGGTVRALWKMNIDTMAVKRVAVIGLGPSGAISIDALAQEQAFDVIRVFERRDAPGGCW
jgi:cation diffusion facilitator CzcD-associated flavoprotein CzcO